MSKSLGNVISPKDIMATSGADILRIWVASSNFNEDIKLVSKILKDNQRVTEKLGIH